MFNQSFFAKNRAALQKSLKNHLVVIAANSLVQSSADMAFPFRQDSNFWYLTGINEPDLILVINTTNGESTLLLPDQNDYQKEWDGENKSEELMKISGIKNVDSTKSLKSRLKEARNKGLAVGYLKPLEKRVEPYGFYANPARHVLEKALHTVEPEPEDIRIALARQRQVKQPEEITAIQKAIDITAETLADVHARLPGFKTEKDLERAISAGFYDKGGDGHAYEPIVASGSNAATIHYQKNNAPLQPDSLLLLDVGALYEGYAADISRTWVVGAASQRHKDLYAMVLELQQKAYSLLKPGTFIREYQKEVEEEAKKACKKLGIVLGQYPHGFSHFLGIDVHDAGDYDAPLEPGVVMTVEPGIYLKDEGVGLRIEDNVLVTKTGIEILSKNIPNDL